MFALLEKNDGTGRIIVPMVDVDTGKQYQVEELVAKHDARLQSLHPTRESAEAKKQQLEAREGGNWGNPN